MARTRDEQTRRNILAAVLKLLRKKSYSDISIEEIARVTGVGKSTIYRWWTSKAELTVSAFYEGSFEALEFEDTESVDKDFRLQITELGKFLRSPRGGLLINLIIGSRYEPMLKKALWDKWTEPRMKWGVAKMNYAKEKNLLLDGVDIFIALNALYGPLYSRIFMGAGAMNESDLCAHLDLLLPAIFKTYNSQE